mgnify:CR=1 FL=1
MSHQSIDVLKSVTGTLLFTGGGIALSLQEIESYLRITSLLVGTIGTGVNIIMFIKNYRKQ